MADFVSPPIEPTSSLPPAEPIPVLGSAGRMPAWARDRVPGQEEPFSRPPAEPVEAINPDPRTRFDKLVEQERANLQGDLQDENLKADTLKWQAQNTNVSPGEAAEIAKYVAATGWDAATVRQNLETLQKEYAYQIDWHKLVKEHPVLAQMVGDPEIGPLILTDTATLQGVEAWLGRWETRPPAENALEIAEEQAKYSTRGTSGSKPVAIPVLKVPGVVQEKLSRGWDSLERSIIGFNRAWGINRLELLLTPSRAKKFAEDLWAAGGDWSKMKEAQHRAVAEVDAAYDARVRYLSEHLRGGKTLTGDLRGYGVYGRGIINAASDSIEYIPTVLAQLLGTSAMAYATGGASLTPELAHLTRSATWGFNYLFNTMLSTGNVYNVLREYKDPETGMTFSEAQAAGFATAGGLLSGLAMTPGTTAITTQQLQMLGQRILPESMADAVTMALSRDTLPKIMWDGFTQVGVHTLEGALTMAAGAGIDAGVEQLAMSWGLGKSADPRVVTAAMGQTFVDSLRTLPFLVSWGPTSNAMRRIGMMRRAENNARLIDVLLTGAQNSKLAKDAPELYENFVKRAADAAPGNPKAGFVNRTVWDESLASMGLDPRAVHAEIMGDKGAAYDLAVKSMDADITIPVEKIGRLSQAPALQEFAIREMRLSAIDISLGDRIRYTAELAKALEQELKKNDQQRQNVSDEIEKWVSKLIKGVRSNPAADAQIQQYLAGRIKPENENRIIQIARDLVYTDVVSTWLTIPEAQRGPLLDFYNNYYKNVNFLDVLDITAGKGKGGMIFKPTGKQSGKPGITLGAVIPDYQMGVPYTRDGRPIEMTMLAGADTLTFFHEWMHLQTYLKERLVKDYEKAGNMFPLLQERYKKMLDLMGSSYDLRWGPDFFSKSQEYAAREEKIAHLFEEYLLANRMPPDALVASAMEDLAQILRTERFAADVGQTGYAERRLGQRGYLAHLPEGAKLDHKAIEYFDSILTGEAAVNFGGATVGAYTIDKIMEGLDPKFQEIYKEWSKRAEDSARGAVVAAVQAAQRARTEGWMKDAQVEVENRISAAMRQDRAYRAIEYLTNGKMLNADDPYNLLGGSSPDGKKYRLDGEAVKAKYGKDAYDLLRKNFPEIFATSEDAKLSADDAATLLGFESGDKMLSEIASHRPFDEQLQAAVDSKMVELYGKLYKPDASALAKEALEAFTHSKAMFEKTLIELKWLGMKLDPDHVKRAELMSQSLMLQMARDVLSQRAFSNFRPEQFLAAERAYAEKAFIAIEKGEFENAYAFKEAQMFNSALYGESLRQQKEIKTAIARLKHKARSDEFRGQLGLADPTYRDAFDALAFSLGVGKNVPGDLGAVFGAFMKQVQAHSQEGLLIFDPTMVVDLLQQLQTRHPTVGEVQTLINVSANIAAIGAKLREAQVGERRMVFDGMRQEILADLQKLPKQRPAPLGGAQRPSAMDEFIKKGQAVDALLLDPELLVEMVGPAAHKYIFKPYLEARFKEDALRKEVLDWMLEKWENPGAELGKLTDKVIPELDTELPIDPSILSTRAGPRDHSWLWMVALNMGNAQNRQRLLDGFGWSADKVLEVLDNHLSPKEWDFIEEVWKFLDSKLWPEIVAKENRMVGLPPRRVEHMPFVLPFSGREIRGGYFPLRYDPKSARSVERQVDRAVSGEILEPPQTTPHSFTFKRVEKYIDTVYLNWNVLPAHINQVLHDLSFGEYLRDMKQLLRDPALQSALDLRLGEQRNLALRNWFSTIAMNGSEALAPHQEVVVGELLGGMKRGMMTAVLGLSFPVIAADFLNPIVAALGGQISFRDLAAGMASGMMPATYDFARSKSRELASRQARYVQTYHELMGRPALPDRTEAGSRYRRIQETAYFFMERMDRLTSTQIWMAKYREGMRKNPGDEAAAIEAADYAVRHSLPSGTLLEKPDILRDRKTLGMLVVFYGWFSKTYNMSRAQMHNPWIDYINAPPEMKLSKAGHVAMAAGRTLAMLIFSTAMGDYVSGRGKEQDETWGQWFARKSIAAPANALPLIPGMAEMAADYAVGRKVRRASLRQAPSMALFQQILTNLGTLASDNKTSDDKFWAVLHTALIGAGLPANQVRRTGQYLDQAFLGDRGVDGPMDFASGVLYGERQRQPSNPLTDFGDATGVK